MPGRADTPRRPEVDKTTLNYFLQRRAQDPDAFKGILEQLQRKWDELPPAQRDAISTAQQLVQPDDVAERGRSTAAMLLAGYILQEIEQTHELNDQLALPSPRTEDDTPPPAA